jgi:hypothetical protein
MFSVHISYHETGYNDLVFRGIPQSFQAIAGIVPKNYFMTTSFHILSNSSYHETGYNDLVFRGLPQSFQAFAGIVP